jgi:hypothetical protein
MSVFVKLLTFVAAIKYWQAFKERCYVRKHYGHSAASSK